MQILSALGKTLSYPTQKQVAQTSLEVNCGFTVSTGNTVWPDQEEVGQEALGNRVN